VKTQAPTVRGDGRKDLVTASTRHGVTVGTVSMLVNRGHSRFGRARQYPSGTDSDPVTIGDLNGDGKLDLATANSESVSVLINRGDGRFLAHRDYTAEAYPFDVAIGDLNGDSRADLATVNTDPLRWPPEQRLGVHEQGRWELRGQGRTERGGDEVGDEAVHLQPVRQLSVRAPVVAPLPAEPLAFDAEHGGDQVGAGLVEQPVRLRLAGAEARGRVEAIEHTLAVEEEQPVLRPPRGGEEEQRQLIGRQQLLLVEAERDLPIALCQVPGEVGEALRAHARSAARLLRTTRRPLFVGLAGVPDHAASRAFPSCSPEQTTPGIASPKTPSKTPPEARPRHFAAAASNSSAINATASRSRPGASGTCRGANNRNSVFCRTHL
jgi:hypothetical protein